MSTEFHVRVREVIDAVLAAAPEQQDACLAELCGEDERLLAEVRALLPHYIQLGEFDPGGPERSLLRVPGTTTFTRMAQEEGDELEWQPPFSIAPYTVKEIIGRGGMGVVYRAEHRTRVGGVAIKILRRRLHSQEHWRRFKYEEEVLRQLRHPGIARLLHGGLARIIRHTYDGTAEEERPYFVMEYVQGRPLTRYADEHELGALERLELFTRVCEAVEYAHHRGVVHRDLKPDNILVDETGQPKVLDFGIAEVQTFESSVVAGAKPRQFAGTLAYCSPEQRASHGHPLTPASDVYTLGLIAHELLTGRLPRRRDGELMLDLRKLRLDGADRQLPGDEFRYCVSVVIATALRKTKGRRYTTAGELGADLAEVLRAYTAPTGWRALMQRLNAFVHGRASDSGAQHNRLLAAVLRKRIGMAMERQQRTNGARDPDAGRE